MTTKDDQKIPVIEIFGPTIQGEGMVIGHRTHFIRFGGCDYKCKKCDSMHAVDGESIRQLAVYLDQDEVYTAIKEKMEPQDKMITFSGGNPALWELGKTISRLHDAGIAVAVETQGTYWKHWLHACQIVTVSPKGPGMGEKFEPDAFRNYCELLKYHKGFNVKVVVFSNQDLEFALEVKELMRDVGVGGKPFFLSVGNTNPPQPKPMHALESNQKQEVLELRQILLDDMTIMAEEILQDKRCAEAGFIFLPQMHVLMWGNRQGV